jgi:hypothetical protein
MYQSKKIILIKLPVGSFAFFTSLLKYAATKKVTLYLISMPIKQQIDFFLMLSFYYRKLRKH